MRISIDNANLKIYRDMLINSTAAKCVGIDAIPVTVEVNINMGIGIHLVGLADVADDPHLHRDDLQLLAGLLADHLLAGTTGAGALMLG